MITNPQSGTHVDEVADGIYRISTPIPPSMMPGGFSFNQYLVVDDEPLLFHTGGHLLFPVVSEAIERVMPVSRLKWISFSHVEADECGALNDFLAAAPESLPLCSRVAAQVSIGDMAARPPRALADGEAISIGSREMEWIDAPHVPHNWETGYVFDRRTRTLFCGDLFTQGGHDNPPITSGDILESTSRFRDASTPTMYDYWSGSNTVRPAIERMIGTRPTTLAVMHGSAWHGEESGARELLLALADRIASSSS